MTCRQISPFIPGNYKDSSLPGSVFEWKVENHGAGSKDLKITLGFTFKNGWGSADDWKRMPWTEEVRLDEDGENKGGNMTGVQMHQTYQGLRFTYAIAGMFSESFLL